MTSSSWSSTGPGEEHEVTESWDEVVASLTAAYGLSAWGAELGDGSFLTLELGEPSMPGGERGLYHLSISRAGWRIEDEAAVLAGSADDYDELARRVRVLDGRKLASITVEHPSLSARFEFQGGLALITFSLSSTEGEHWMLFRPDGTVLTMGPGSTWSAGPSEHPSVT
ncbi:MAG TPA: hypothetical protein VE617_13155 [Propionibacteriaceae bacterium]|nr:hypothetical protein [Propionibacteriaceae bacterium]